MLGLVVGDKRLVWCFCICMWIIKKVLMWYLYIGCMFGIDVFMSGDGESL